MATDRELIEAAAKAAWLEFGVIHQRPHRRCAEGWTPWNPMEDDADAFRLAVALRMDLTHNDPRDNDAWVMAVGLSWVETVDGEEGRPAATRRAITRAAAHIGGLTDA